jgi:hypothetical protein
MPRTTEIAAQSLDVDDMDALLLKKIEELTREAIARQKRCDDLQKQVSGLNVKLNAR